MSFRFFSRLAQVSVSFVIGSLNSTLDDVKQSNRELAQVLTKKLIISRHRGLSMYNETIFIACRPIIFAKDTKGFYFQGFGWEIYNL